MAASTLTERLRAAGIVDPGATVAEAQRAGLRLPLACAMLEKESAGGHNVFGHDPTIFAGAGEVTQAKYRDYKRKRVGSGNKLMQGVGPCQLTWWSIQDAADQAGGCWRPEINMRIGFGHLAGLVKQHGESDGARRYNGSGDAAVAYSSDLLAKARKWAAILAGAQVPGAARASVVRRGDTGALAEKVTRRLSYVRSRTTQAPYLDGPRRRFGPNAEAALKAFQADHGLTADGVFGPESARKLDRAVRLEKARRQHGAPAPAPAPTPAPAPNVARAKLPALVAEVRRLDGETDEAWKTLVAYAQRRRRLLERLRARKAGGAQVDSATAGALADMAKILLRIEAKLGALVDVEQREAAAAAAPAPGPAPASAQVSVGGIVSDAAMMEPGAGTLAEATVLQTAEATPPSADTNGVGERSSVPATPRKLSDLSEQELTLRIVRLDRTLDRSRSELIRRCAEVEEELAKLLPAERQNGKGGAVTRPPRTQPARRPGDGKRPNTRPEVDDKHDPRGGKVVTTKLGDTGLLVRRSKIALARLLAAKGNQEHAKLRRALRREARTPGRAALATPPWQQAVRAAQHLTGRPVTGEMDGELTRALAPYWPRDNAAKRAIRSTPAWRAIPGQLTPNFNVKELGCKDAQRTSYMQGMMRDQGLTKQAARARAKELAKRLERVRKAGGDRPLIITSAFRTKAYNASLTGSATNSAHTRGFAVDTPPPPGLSLDQHHKHVLSAFECGVGYYPAGRGYFIHGDFDSTLGGRRTWRPT